MVMVNVDLLIFRHLRHINLFLLQHFHDHVLAVGSTKHEVAIRGGDLACCIGCRLDHAHSGGTLGWLLLGRCLLISSLPFLRCSFLKRIFVLSHLLSVKK